MSWKISTVDNLVSVENAMSKILWPRYFIEPQGYKISHTKILRGNKSSVLLGKKVNSTAPNRLKISVLGISLLHTG